MAAASVRAKENRRLPEAESRVDVPFLVLVLLALTGAQVDSVRGLLHWQGSIHWPGILLAAVLLMLTRRVKQTKNLHPVVFIALSAVVGIVFRFAGV